MSLTVDHTSKRARNLFQSCCERKVQFRYRGEARPDRDHARCFECFRAERNRRRATALAPTSTGESLTRAHVPQRLSTMRFSRSLAYRPCQ